jgi:hypothetical protein
MSLLLLSSFWDLEVSGDGALDLSTVHCSGHQELQRAVLNAHMGTEASIACGMVAMDMWFFPSGLPCRSYRGVRPAEVGGSMVCGASHCQVSRAEFGVGLEVFERIGAEGFDDKASHGLHLVPSPSCTIKATSAQFMQLVCRLCTACTVSM